MKVRPETLREVEGAFERYQAEVRAANLERTTEETYINRAAQFVRWLNDDFTPGAGRKR